MEFPVWSGRENGNIGHLLTGSLLITVITLFIIYLLFRQAKQTNGTDGLRFPGGTVSIEERILSLDGEFSMVVILRLNM